MNSLLAVWNYFWNLSPRIAMDVATRCCTTIFPHNDPHMAQLIEQNVLQILLKKSNISLLLYYLYLLYGVFRFLQLGYILQYDKMTQFLEWDTLIGLGAKTKLMNSTGSLCSSALPLFVLYFDYAIRFKHCNYVLRLPYETMIENPKQFLSLNSQFRPKISLLLSNPISSTKATVKEILRVLSMFLDPPKGNRLKIYEIKFHQARLRCGDAIPNKIRVQAILLSWFFQLSSAIFLMCSGRY